MSERMTALHRAPDYLGIGTNITNAGKFAMTDKTVVLESPYGFFTAPGGGRIKNGTKGTLDKDWHPDTYNTVVFEGELHPVRVPGFWLGKPKSN
jgi:hypothetical protein